jgi:DUF1680 family protein
MKREKRLSPVSWKNVRVGDGFWGRRMEVNRRVTLPLQYEQNRKTGALDSYQWEWPEETPTYGPFRLLMGDLGKWIEAASYSLGSHADVELGELAANAAQKIVSGQKEDGYLYGHPLPRRWRWANLEWMHELYDLGHLIEAAVARFEASGERDLLDAVCRYADLIDARFGTEAGKKRGYDGHPEVELALVKLYRATGEERYLKLAKFFVDERGQEPNYFVQERQAGKDVGLPPAPWLWAIDERRVNFLAHKPVRELADAVGHAVRALYLFSGMADVAAETADGPLLAACRRMWKSATRRRMYITGGVGSRHVGEEFTYDYDLPNETAYAESCAAISLVMFAHRMLQIEADGDYADVMERALYNGVLSGVSLDGRRFFYGNPLAAHGHPADDGKAVNVERSEWFGCACCPPNLARIIASVGGYAYSVSDQRAWLHLYIAGEVDLEIDGQPLRLRQETQYPWKDTVRLTVAEGGGSFGLMLRVPGWCRGAKVKVNGKPIALPRITSKGYAKIVRKWAKGDVVEIRFPMPVERIEARPQVRNDCGKVALMRGPIVYCLEEVDNGDDLFDVTLPRRSAFKIQFDKKLDGAAKIVAQGRRRKTAGWGDRLYRPIESASKTFTIRAVPYCLWGNRGTGDMLVWIRDGG